MTALYSGVYYGVCFKSKHVVNFFSTLSNSMCSFQMHCIIQNIYMYYTGCPRRNVPDFGRVFLMLKYTDITQNTYIQS